MEITLSQQYNVGEKPTVILSCRDSTRKTVKTKQRQCSTPSLHGIKKKMNARRPSEHPLVRGKNVKVG